jgi:hypothetical protein
MYESVVDEFQLKIIAKRKDYQTFDEVMEYLVDLLFNRDAVLCQHAHKRLPAPPCRRLPPPARRPDRRRDARDVIRAQDTPGALFFVDPPYVIGTRDKGTHYRHELTDAQHAELLALLQGVRGKVMIAGYASALYDGALTGWTRLTRAHYAASSAGARVRSEVLWIKPD